MAMPELADTSVVTCPACGHRKAERMPTDACMFFYECEGCGALLKPGSGDCCVFCTYGTIPCPSVHNGTAGRAAGVGVSRSMMLRPAERHCPSSVKAPCVARWRGAAGR